MNYQFNTSGCHHIIIDNFLSEQDFKEYNDEFRTMLDKSDDGFYYIEGKPIVDKSFKSRKEFDVYAASDSFNLKLKEIWLRNFWQEKMYSFLDQFGGIFSYVRASNRDHLLGAFYSEGEGYKPHTDLSLVTVVFLHSPIKNFEGGDFYLGNKVNEVDVTYEKIEYIPNRLLIFPSRFVHYAENVIKSNVGGVDGMRFCTQNFINIIDVYK